MFDNLFTSSPAIWSGLLAALVALPILIHLINLMRQKTVRWAAMEFLLKSHKKNRQRVWLKQLLLLLSRITVLILSLLMLAQIGCQQDRITKLLGGTTTHHYVLLDDSFSMSDRGAGGTAFDRARSTLSLIAARARNRQNQLFTLLRFSATRPSETLSPEPDNTLEYLAVNGIGLRADLNAELVDRQFDQRVEEVKARLSVSNLSTGPQDALRTVEQLIRQRLNENAIVYVLSDFRSGQWDRPQALDLAMSKIEATGAAIECIKCVTTENPNLALTRLSPVGNVRVAGTPLMMQVTVKNCSNQPAEKVQIRLATLSYPPPNSETVPGEFQPELAEIPTVFIEQIAPGESESRSFPIFFDAQGKHAVVASLPDDAIAVDNVRWNCTEFFPTAKVLLINDQEQKASRFLSLALDPGGMTGISPEIRTRDFLRDVTPETLSEFDVLFLLDVETLDESAVRNLESFALAGGGVAFFLGPNTNIDTVNNQWFRGGAGIFPIPLDQVIDVPELIEERIPDIAPMRHPMFAPLMDSRTSLLDRVQVKTMVQPPSHWQPASTPGVDVIATIRGRENWPLCVEKPFGKGRVIAFTTSAGPSWNNWSRNATFPPIMLLMQDYLAAGKFQDPQKLVGMSIEISVPAKSFLPTATVVAPTGTDGTQMSIEKKLNQSTVPGELALLIGGPADGDIVRETDFPGIYDAWLQQTDANQSVQRFALNVDVEESDMQLTSSQKILADLKASTPTLVQWDTFNPEPKQNPTSTLSKLLLFLLVGFLVVEQGLAYSTSYHGS